MPVLRQGILIFFCWTMLCCQEAPRNHESANGLPDQSYVQLLERIEKAGNRYRAAMDLVKQSLSALERSLADTHLQLTREILKSELELAEIETKELEVETERGAEAEAASGNQPGQEQYEKAAAEVWKIYSDVEATKKRLAEARQNLKRATNAETFRRAQQGVEEAQKEAEIADKKLDLAGSNLDIEDYERKKAAPILVESRSLAERLKMLREDLMASPGKSGSAGTMQAQAAEGLPSPQFLAPEGNGIVSGFRDFLKRQAKLQTLRRVHAESLQQLEETKQNLTKKTQQLEVLQAEHVQINKKAEAAYSQAYELLKDASERTKAYKLLEEADRLMKDSTRCEDRKSLVNRAISMVRQEAALVLQDNEKLVSWVGVALDGRVDALTRLSTRLGIVLSLIVLILLVAHYLKKIPYRFTAENKNVYYFRKLISFSTGIVIVLIILLNFVSDFGSISAVVGLAGAGLAIALQDPIVSLVGWFLIIGKFGISVGDRVEINNVKGDVIDIGLLRITILEVGNWVSAEQATGRVVFFPNSFIFKSHFFNYSTGNSFIWDEIRITVTYESDWKRARQIIEEVAERVCIEFVEKAKATQEQVSRRFHINLGTLTPYVYVSIADSGVDLVLRYLTEIRRRRITHDLICRDMLEAFDRERKIDLAYPTRRNVTETKVVSVVQNPS